MIDSDKYEVIYVSPRNYFVFTPMLAAASVGTVDVRSITEPIRMANPCVKYVSGEVIDVVPGEKKVSLIFFFGSLFSRLGERTAAVGSGIYWIQVNFVPVFLRKFLITFFAVFDDVMMVL